MNRNFFPHIIWCLVASISFIVGYKFFPAGDIPSAGTIGMEQGDLSLADSESLKSEAKKASSQQGKGTGFEIGGNVSSEKKYFRILRLNRLDKS